jgi:hypothetical protein
LTEAAASGASRVKVKMTEAVTLAKLHGPDRVDWALGHAACYQRFGDGDLVSILTSGPVTEHRHASENHSLQTGTSAWEGYGQ